MKLTLQLGLKTCPEQSAALVDTMRRFNEAASCAARVGFDSQTYTQAGIHRLCYKHLRERFGLSAQMAVRAISKAVETFRRDKTVRPVFSPDGAMAYDERILSFKAQNCVSILTVGMGRILVGYSLGEYQARQFGFCKGQCDLVCRRGRFYLYCTIDVPEEPLAEVADYLGVDLGIVNLATTSEGESFSGDAVNRNRRRRATARKQYQRRGTKSAKRRLKKMSGRQRRFQTNINHSISKRIVDRAKTLGVGIAIEDLSGIRDRVEQTVSRRFRRKFGNWSFFQLRAFVEYKARLAGIPVVAVNPRYSSQTCYACGHCERANRKSQSEFLCKQCGLSTNADENAALNLRVRALGPISNLAPKVSTFSQGQSPRL